MVEKRIATALRRQTHRIRGTDIPTSHVATVAHLGDISDPFIPAASLVAPSSV